MLRQATRLVPPPSKTGSGRLIDKMPGIRLEPEYNRQQKEEGIVLCGATLEINDARELDLVQRNSPKNVVDSVHATSG